MKNTNISLGGLKGSPVSAPVLLPTLAILATVVFWGMSFVSSKAVLNSGVPPMTLAFLRFLIASVVLYPLLKRLEPQSRIIPGSRIRLVLSSLSGVTVYFYFETKGIQMTSASSASMIIASVPIFTICMEYFFYKNRLPWYKIVGVLLSMAGVYFIIGKSGDNGSNPQALIGNLFMLGACLSWVAYIIFSRNLNRQYTGLALTTYQALFGTLFLFPLALLERSQWVALSLSAWLNLLYLALFCTAASYFFYIYALKNLGAVVISSYINLIPVVSVAGGILLLGEVITPGQALGGIIVIAGVFAVNKNQRKRPPKKEA